MPGANAPGISLTLKNTYCYDYSLKDVVSALNENSEYVIRER